MNSDGVARPTAQATIPSAYLSGKAANAKPYLTLWQTQAIKAGSTLYVSGQIPADSKGNLVEGSIADKTRACAVNIQAILEEAGTTLDKIVKCTVRPILLTIRYPLLLHPSIHEILRPHAKHPGRSMMSRDDFG